MILNNTQNSPLKYCLLGIIIIIIDQVSKKVVLLYDFFSPTCIYRVFHLPPIKNNGFTLDFISMHNIYIRAFINFISLLFVFFLLYEVLNQHKKKNIYGEICILSGGISNLIDRYSYGAVIDFIIFKIPLINYLAIGNIADIAISIGVILFMANLIIEEN